MELVFPNCLTYFKEINLFLHRKSASQNCIFYSPYTIHFSNDWFNACL